MNKLRLPAWLLATAVCGSGLCFAGETDKVMTLEELFEVAEASSSELRSSRSAEEIAVKEISVAKSGHLPDISAQLSLSYIGDGFTTKRDFSDYQKASIPHFGNGVSLNVSQPIYTGGAVTAGIELAEQKLAVSRYATELDRDNIRFRITAYYLELYKCRNLLVVVNENIDNARRLLDEMRARYESGMALQNDITRYELLVSNLELQRVKLQNVLTILNNNLVTEVGLPQSVKVVPDSAILAHSLPRGNELEWSNCAQENSPAIKLAAAQVEMNRSSETLAKSEMLPKIGLQAGWSFDGPILVEVPPINRNLSYWYVGVGVSYNLSSLYKGKRTVSRSRAATANAVDALAVTRENVDKSMRADYVKYLESYEELKTQEKSAELASRNYDVVSVRYLTDMALITDMLDAANSRLDAEVNLVNARINIIYSYYKLLFTSGKI